MTVIDDDDDDDDDDTNDGDDYDEETLKLVMVALLVDTEKLLTLTTVSEKPECFRLPMSRPTVTVSNFLISLKLQNNVIISVIESRIIAVL